MTNVKINENVVCWKCQHFQRYDDSETPSACIGECRFNPPGCLKIGQAEGETPIDIASTTIFPVIVDGSQKWCGNFARSLEKNLPPMPPHNDDSCETEPTLPDDIQIFRGFPWNKHLRTGYVTTPSVGSIACWTCDHFNAKDQSQTPLGTSGECHRQAPCGYVFGQEVSGDFWAVGYFPSVRNGVCDWCSQWERARHAVYAPPSWDCGIRNQQLKTEGSTVAAVSVATTKKATKTTK